MIKNYSALHESMQTRTLANGLRICYLPKRVSAKPSPFWRPISVRWTVIVHL